MRKLQLSYESIREVYDRESRKANIDVTLLPVEYQNIITTIRDKRTELSGLKRTAIRKLDADAQAACYDKIDAVKEEIKQLAINKEEALTAFLHEIEKKINSRSFIYEIERDSKTYRGNEYFHIKNKNLETRIFSKLLCEDLASSFKVKAANRHHIMACIKSLLDKDKDFIIIRTDIKSFFESIPHQLILDLLSENTFVSKKTIGCIRSILMQYDKLKTSGIQGIGVPRGIGVSSYLSEIVMREFDMNVQRRPNVMFYARYVDDIFIVLSHVQVGVTVKDLFIELENEIKKYDLSLHPIGSGKSQLVEYLSGKPKTKIEYLGYRIDLVPANKSIVFTFSSRRYDRLKNRIERAFQHFEKLYLKDPRQARRDLLDSLNLLSGNTNLRKTKSGVKTGMYYSHDVLSPDCDELKKLRDKCLKSHIDNLTLKEAPFGSAANRDCYLDRLKTKLSKIDFLQRWNEKKMYSFSIERMKTLSQILG